MINKVTLIGNLGSDPELRRLENGTSVARFSLATNESYKDTNGEWQTLTEWHNILVWRELADRAEKSLKKGALVYLEGKISSRKYKDKDGNERQITEIVANTVRSLEIQEKKVVVSDQQPSSQIEHTNKPNSNTTYNDLPF